jgi:endonuclease/exonuclease/phosphatase family metal-dependent hydrolase
MCVSISSNCAAARRNGTLSLLAAAVLACGPAWADSPPVVTVMTRNVDAGTDLNYIFAATDQASFLQGTAATLAEVKASAIPERAALLAGEIAAQNPDLISLQEVTLWRTGPSMQPPATDVLYDQLDLLLQELGKRKLHYGVVAIQTLVDAEAPVPTEGIDIRLTDRDVILARLDAPQALFDLTNAQVHRYQAQFTFGSALLGQIVVPRGWMSADVSYYGTKFRFVATHLESTVPGLPQAQQVQEAQADELIAALATTGMPVVLAGDFNANAEPGPENTATVRKLVVARYADAWRVKHPGDPGYTWPLFGEDQLAGPSTPNERIDLIFTYGLKPNWFTGGLPVVSAERTGVTMPASGPWASDHAGLVVKVQVQ